MARRNSQFRRVNYIRFLWLLSDGVNADKSRTTIFRPDPYAPASSRSHTRVTRITAHASDLRHRNHEIRLLFRITHVSCTSCGSENLRTFKGEVAIQLMPIAVELTVFVWPEIVVCLDCGVAEFSVPRAELGVLAKGTPTAGFRQD